MTYHVRADTLAGIKQSALFRERDFAATPVATVVEAMNGYTANLGQVLPDAEAVKFYYANHVFSLLAAKFDPHEPLPPVALSLARDYVKMSSALVARLTYYTLMIITREMRHAHGGEAKVNSFAPQYGQPFCTFVNMLTSKSESSSVHLLKTSPPATSIGQYCAGMEELFVKGGFSGGYGNKPWSVIAGTLRKLVCGEITPEMFADTAFTLAHNNGPMFNKGMLYSMYDQHFILKLLDVQRSGQVPQMHASGFVPSHFIDLELGGYINRANGYELISGDLGGYVDWFKVEALGALKTYSSEKQTQLAVHGPSPYQNVKKGASEAVLFYVSLHEAATVTTRKKPKIKKAA